MNNPKTFTFHNVTISLYAKDGKQAYTKLCNALTTLEADWWTDTYSSNEDSEVKSTRELFPKA